MKAEFYYKETFPLRLDITIVNINELRLLLTFFEKVAAERADASTTVTGDRKTELKSYIIKEEKETNKAIHLDVFNQIKTLLEEHERRDLLQREVSEGAENSDPK
jgi:hypothetical protein